MRKDYPRKSKPKPWRWHREPSGLSAIPRVGPHEPSGIAVVPALALRPIVAAGRSFPQTSDGERRGRGSSGRRAGSPMAYTNSGPRPARLAIV